MWTQLAGFVRQAAVGAAAEVGAFAAVTNFGDAINVGCTSRSTDSGMCALGKAASADALASLATGGLRFPIPADNVDLVAQLAVGRRTVRTVVAEQGAATAAFLVGATLKVRLAARTGNGGAGGVALRVHTEGASGPRRRTIRRQITSCHRALTEAAGLASATLIVSGAACWAGKHELGRSNALVVCSVAELARGAAIAGATVVGRWGSGLDAATRTEAGLAGDDGGWAVRRVAAEAAFEIAFRELTSVTARRNSVELATAAGDGDLSGASEVFWLALINAVRAAATTGGTDVAGLRCATNEVWAYDHSGLANEVGAGAAAKDSSSSGNCEGASRGSPRTANEVEVVGVEAEAQAVCHLTVNGLADERRTKEALRTGEVGKARAANAGWWGVWTIGGSRAHRLGLLASLGADAELSRRPASGVVEFTAQAGITIGVGYTDAAERAACGWLRGNAQAVLAHVVARALVAVRTVDAAAVYAHQTAGAGHSWAGCVGHTLAGVVTREAVAALVGVGASGAAATVNAGVGVVWTLRSVVTGVGRGWTTNLGGRIRANVNGADRSWGLAFGVVQASAANSGANRGVADGVVAGRHRGGWNSGRQNRGTVGVGNTFVVYDLWQAAAALAGEVGT